MNDEYELEILADSAIDELREFINTEKQLVQEEHDILSKLQSWDYLVGHIDERIPSNLTSLHELNRDIAEKLIEIRDLIESDKLYGLKIIKEEIEILVQLDESVEHRNWQAVKKNIDLETQQKDKNIRLKKSELKELHSKLIDLMKLIKRSELSIEEDFTQLKEKEEYEKLENYYFIQLYKFARAYERILRHLWRKSDE